MNRYDLSVRGENVHIEFTRINDSRRLADYRYGTDKKPNLFGVMAAMTCAVQIPITMVPDWLKKSDTFRKSPYPYTCKGVAFCSRKDEWSPIKGRHTALREALAYHDHDDMLNAEIVAAFTLAEKARTKVKGPERTPRTAKRKAWSPRKRTLVHLMVELKQALDKLASPLGKGEALTPEQIAQTEEKASRWLCGVEVVHPVDTPTLEQENVARGTAVADVRTVLGQPHEVNRA